MNTKVNKDMIIDKCRVSAAQLVTRVKAIVAEGRAHEIVISDKNGQVNLVVSVNKGAAVGTVAALGAPILSLIAAAAALATDHTIEIRRKKIG